MFQRGTCYTRREIHEAVGGDIQSYLPSRNGVIVAACLAPRVDPDAPAVILPGTGPGIELAAERLVGQGGPVPVFLKRAPKAWEYVGDHRVAYSSLDPAEIAKHARRSGRSDITRVIHLTDA